MTRIECEGWWEQGPLGRQPMRSLALHFEQGTIDGTGADVIGSFRFTGTMNAGRVMMVKHYLGKHTVDYRGQYDGEGTFYGSWSVGGFRGDWSIQFASAAPADEIRELA